VTSDKRKHRARRFAVEAPLHLLKLLPGNAHTNRLPARADGQKQKRRDEFGRGVRENFRLNGFA
jgi:hypothetical protein